MKKIFTISVFSVFAVMGVASAAPDLYDGAGTSANLNVATVNYVDNAIARAKPDTSGLLDKANTVNYDGTNMNGDNVGGSLEDNMKDFVPTLDYVNGIDQMLLGHMVAKPQVLTSEFKDLTGKQYDLDTVVDIDKDDMVPTIGLVEAALDEKVDKTSVVSSTGTVTSDDTQIPTIKRMESAIANAKPDTSGLVDKAAVVISGGVRTMTGGAVATDANKDAYVPTVAYAQEMATSAASGAVAELEPKFQERVPYATGIADGFLVTDSTGNVYVNHGVPSSITDAVEDQISVKLNSPDEVCSQPGNCALVFAGVDGNGNPVLQWEKIARSVAEQTAE